MSNFLTYNNVIDILKDIANRHYQINTFYLGRDWDIENDADIQYPVMQVYPTLAKMPRNAQGEFKTIQINMNIKVVDLVQQSQENERDVHSDMLQVAQDIINELNQHPFYQNSNVSIIGDINLSNLEEYNDDFTAGWQFDLNLQMVNNNTFCGIPADPKTDVTYNGPVATGYSYTQVVTCDTLESCPVIINIDDRITTLETIVYQQNQLISGSVSYLSGLTFDVTPLVYVIDGIIYNITNATQVTVSSGDTTYDRIDTIYADIYGNTGVIEGTPSDNPVKPSVDPSTQVEVSFVSIPAGGSAPAVTETLVFDEATPVVEWDISSISTPWVSLSTVQSYTGTKSVRFSASTTSRFVEFSAATVFDTTNQNTIQFAIKNPIAWPTSARLNINLLSNAGVTLGSTIQLYNGIYGFSSTNISTWQIISIPVSAFNIPTPFIGRLRFTASVTAPQVFNTYIDLVKFVTGVPSTSVNPQWRYMRVDNGTSIGPATSTDTLILSGGTNIGTRISGTNTVVFDLDNNIRVTGLTATTLVANTVSATTYVGLPSINVNQNQVAFGSGVTGTITSNANFSYDGTNAAIGSSAPTNDAKLFLESNSNVPLLIKNGGGSNSFEIRDSSNTAQIYIDYTNQLAFNAGIYGPIYFGTFYNPSAGLAGFSKPGEVFMAVSAQHSRMGVGGGGAYFAANNPQALLEVKGKANEVQLKVSGFNGQTKNIVEVTDASGLIFSIDDIAQTKLHRVYADGTNNGTTKLVGIDSVGKLFSTTASTGGGETYWVSGNTNELSAKTEFDKVYVPKINSSTGGNSQLDLNKYGSGEILLSTDNGAYSDAVLYIDPYYIELTTYNTGSTMSMYLPGQGIGMANNNMFYGSYINMYGDSKQVTIEDTTTNPEVEGIYIGYTAGGTQTNNLIIKNNSTNTRYSNNVDNYIAFLNTKNSSALPSVYNSAIIGGDGITATASNTVYVPYLNIKNFTGTTAVAGLAIDANGNVVTGSTGSDIYVTGGTYNPANGTTTLLRNDGGIVTISGYSTVSSVTGLTSGLISGGNVTINAIDNTKIDIAAGEAVIVDFWTNIGIPVEYRFSWAPLTGVSVTYLTANTQSYIAIDKNGNITQYPSRPDNDVRRLNIVLAQLGHAAKTVVASVNQYTSAYDSPIEAARDIIEEFKLINEGNIVSANGANLNINKSSGYLFGMGVNHLTDPLNPNKIFVSGQTAASFRYRTMTGGTTSPVTSVNPTVYDNNGVITSIGGSSNQATNQRIYLFPNGNLVIQYGQTVYTTLANAISNAQYESFVEFENLADSAILIGILSVTKGCTALNDTSNARFLRVSKLGETVGSAAGISTSTLQNTYDNSSQPEIVTNSTLGAVTIKDGVGSGVNVLEIQNTGGTVNMYVTGNGDLSASTITGRARKRIVNVASSATPALNTDLADIARLTGLTTNITNASTNLTGTPSHGDLFSYEITDNGTARTITWGTAFSNTGTLSLPTTTVISTLLRCLFQYNSITSKWEIVAVV